MIAAELAKACESAVRYAAEREMTPQQYRDRWQYRGRRGWEAEFEVPSEADRYGYIPFAASLRALDADDDEDAPLLHRPATLSDLTDVIGERPKEYRFENIRTGYGDAGDLYGVTGTGGAATAMRHAGNLLTAALAKYQPKVVIFTAAEPSRVSLYRRLARRFREAAPDYHIFETPAPSGGKAFAAVHHSVADDVAAVAAEHNIPFTAAG